ncbi:MAG: FtsX-like permease family protein, partial [Candidatus Dormiibacterota bacterium]
MGIAAPLEIVGYVLETAVIPVSLSQTVVGQSGATVLTLSSRFTADDGLSKYPSQSQGYVYVTPDPLSQFALDRETGTLTRMERLPNGSSVPVCAVGATSAAQTSPFQTSGDLGLDSCYSRVAKGLQEVQGYVDWSFPVLVAGIDPKAENQLSHLGRAVSSGRYLTEGEGTTKIAGTSDAAVPLLASSTTFDGDSDEVTVSALPPSAVQVVKSGKPAAQITQALSAEPATGVQHVTITGAQAWQELLHDLSVPITADSSAYAELVGQYWTAGPVSYRLGAGGQLDAVPVANPDSVWTAGLNVNGLKYVPAPPAAADTGFRKLVERTETGAAGVSPSGPTIPLLQVVGQFDPGKLAGFSGSGAASPLASYRAPLLTGADAVSRTELGDRALEPDGNMAGYAQPAPLLYTSLAGAAALEAPAAAASENDTQASRPVGSIRVRVSGLRGTVAEQLAKIAAVGQEIEKSTGLRVIVTAGASPQPVTIGLPAGAFGRPALRLTEEWTAIGVSLIVLRQADRESLALLVLILVVCGLFLAGAALAGARGRRAEIGVLRALGWDRRHVFVVVLGEVVLLGVVAGVVGAGLSAALIAGLKLSVPLWRAALVLPVAAGLATLSAVAPAWLAARIQPAGALTPVARAPRHTGRRIRSVTGLAFTGVARVPGRCVLAGAGLALAVA